MSKPKKPMYQIWQITSAYGRELKTVPNMMAWCVYHTEYHAVISLHKSEQTAREAAALSHWPAIARRTADVAQETPR